MKKLILFTFSFLFTLNIAFADEFTQTATFNLNLEEAELDPEKVEVIFSVRCNYEKKIFDIIQGKTRSVIKSCGELDQKIYVRENGTLTLPGVSRFRHRKGDDFNNYTIYLSMNYNRQHLLDIAQWGEQQITDFYNKKLNISFKRFLMRGFEIHKDGLNLIDHPNFMGDQTPISLEFSIDRSNEITISDSNFKRYHRAHLRPLIQLNGGNPENNGKIFLGPNYYPFFNDENLNVIISISTRDKDGNWLKKTVRIPFTPETLLNMKEIEL